MNALRTLVVGGGVAGLATARALGLAGFEVEVVERQPRWRYPGAGMYLPGNTTRALGELGLADAVRDRAVEITRQRFCDHRGRLLCEVDLTRLWGQVGPCLALPRAELHEVLRAGVGGAIRMGLTVTAIAVRGAGKVTVAFSDQTSGDYDLVVGADGIDSTVRRLAFGEEAVPRPVGQVGWRFVVPCPPQVADWSVLLGRRAAFLTLPIGSGRAYCYADVVAPPGTAAPTADEAARLRALFGAFAEPAGSILEALDGGEVHTSVIEEVAIASWVRGRVVLVGDAAHATSPNMAEGAGMAVEDALVLAESLTVAPAVPEALARFEARRRPRTDWVRAQTHRRDHTRYLPPAVGHTALRVLGRRIVHGNYRPLRAAI